MMMMIKARLTWVTERRIRSAGRRETCTWVTKKRGRALIDSGMQGCGECRSSIVNTHNELAVARTQFCDQSPKLDTIQILAHHAHLKQFFQPQNGPHRAHQGSPIRYIHSNPSILPHTPLTLTSPPSPRRVPLQRHLRRALRRSTRWQRLPLHDPAHRKATRH